MNVRAEIINNEIWAEQEAAFMLMQIGIGTYEGTCIKFIPIAYGCSKENADGMVRPFFSDEFVQWLEDDQKNEWVLARNMYDYVCTQDAVQALEKYERDEIYPTFVGTHDAVNLLFKLSLDWEEGDNADTFMLCFFWHTNDEDMRVGMFNVPQILIEYLNGERPEPFVLRVIGKSL